ncbi:MAG: 4-formylbenzenesulfonate dehydrogenase TsaC1/TsaC2 [Syntrophaceae bacterium PtaU1.Bin231]|nr:MAG: 4-formylbenzenesulfonate dehydrogenase TsaC1/TsaC2 [Syntrophaceae bacterium PtaU1.Bin231]
MVNFSLKDRVALITGASRGIGEAIALTLAEYGAHCILASRKIDALKSVEDKIKAAGGTADSIACNMGNIQQIEAMMEEIGKRFGKLNILVNNAATNPHFGSMVSVEEGAWDKTHEVNLKGPFFLIQKVVPLMEASGGGAIVNVASINGISPGANQGIYSITKAGVILMTKAYAQELAPKKIRVNALLPGLTKTKFAGALFEDEAIYSKAVKNIPMGRAAGPEEMAGAVLYFVSDASSFTTGACLICDGGRLI